ncbi:helix-turn-helix domain-containing protein [Ruegeria sp. 1NDH52C]|uniref:Helix-turn-helix domain-containing protein n=1 Tax=Ruegeria alba TaxID=2916756 RepID=A0ABS9NSI5_9RHOB|nr:helix-turn-helix domain-containing protein [Ruegeria alba]MCG6556914.1 helix-turn-helix domain-containing protein [Ruegeria alba]
MIKNAAVAPALQPDKFYTGKEIAALLSVHVTTLYAWMRAGKFPLPQRIGPRTVRWTGRQVIDYLSDNLPW